MCVRAIVVRGWPFALGFVSDGCGCVEASELLVHTSTTDGCCAAKHPPRSTRGRSCTPRAPHCTAHVLLSRNVDGGGRLIPWIDGGGGGDVHRIGGRGGEGGCLRSDMAGWWWRRPGVRPSVARV